METRGTLSVSSERRYTLRYEASLLTYDHMPLLHALITGRLTVCNLGNRPLR